MGMTVYEPVGHVCNKTRTLIVNLLKLFRPQMVGYMLIIYIEHGFTNIKNREQLPGDYF